MTPVSQIRRQLRKIPGLFLLVAFCAASVFAAPQDTFAGDENKTAENTGALPAFSYADGQRQRKQLLQVHKETPEELLQTRKGSEWY